MGGHKMENEMWRKTLENLAAHFGVHEPVEMNPVCRPQAPVEHYRNIWHNAGIRSALYTITASPPAPQPRETGLVANSRAAIYNREW